MTVKRVNTCLCSAAIEVAMGDGNDDDAAACASVMSLEEVIV